MKHLRLFLVAIAAVFGLNANAQSWTAEEVAAGDYVLYNVGTGKFLTRGNGWGTQASISAKSPLTVTLEEFDGAYKLRTNINGSGNGFERLGDPVIYSDQSHDKNSTWTFTKVADASNGPVYTIVSKDNHGGGANSYMTASADNTIVGPAEAVTDDYGRWQLFKAWITNSQPVSDANGWTTSQGPTFDNGNICAEFWNKSGASIKQTLSNLPAGNYDLIAAAFTRTGMTATLYAGPNTMNIATASTSDANNRSQANTWFNTNDTNGLNKLEFTHAGGNLEIGLIADNSTGDHWLVWRSFVLLYKGLDLSTLKEALQAQINAVPALEGTTPAAAYNAAKEYADGINVDALTTEEEISTASAELSALVDAAKALQAPYSRYNEVKAACVAVNSGLDTTDADEQANAATTAEAIETAVAAVRATLLAVIPEMEIAEGGFIDLTNAIIDNPTVSQNVDYWNVDNVGRPKSWSTGPTTNFGETEFYQSTFDFNQLVKGLPMGTYEFGVSGFHRAGTHATYFYAGVDKILIPGVPGEGAEGMGGIEWVNSMAQAKTYFDNGKGKVALKFALEDESNDIKIGIVNNDGEETDRWTIFRDFTLKYFGTAIDLTEYDNRWKEAVAAAEAALADEANAKVTGDELTAITAAKADVPEQTKASYIEKTDALLAATQAFIAAAPAYDAYAAEKAIAEMIGVTPGEEPANAAAAAAGVNALKVAEFDFVKENYTYDYEPVIGTFGEWTATALVADEAAEPNYLSREHWSGQTHAYYEQAENGWGNEKGWYIKYEKTAKLPAGDYMLKVAARSSAGTTSVVSCTATENTVSLPTAGNATKGIALDGTASFEGDNFANGGNGFGWEWRFLPFTLTETAEVTMYFEAYANSQYQWMSIADATLLSKQEIQNIVEIAGTDEWAPEAQVASQVLTDRKLLEGLNTVIFPFETTDAELGATTVLAYTGTTVEADGLTFNFQKVAPVDGVVTLQANTPYAVFVAADQTENLTFGSKNINPGGGWYYDLVTDDPNDQYDFRGIYTEVKKGNDSFITNKDYIAGKERFVKAKGGNGLKAYRAYLQFVGTEEPANVAFNFGGFVVDGIEAVELLNNLSGNIYNLNGQKLQKAQKGINIVNGKKVLVK